MGLGKTIFYTGLTGIILGCGAAALTQEGPAQALKNFQRTVLEPVVETVSPQKAQPTPPAIAPTTQETPAKNKTGNTKRHPDFGKSTICQGETNERISLLPIANRSQNFLSSENPTVICRGDPGNSGFFATNPNTVQLTLSPNAQINPDNPGKGVWELNFAIMDRDIPGLDGQSPTRKPAYITLPYDVKIDKPGVYRASIAIKSDQKTDFDFSCGFRGLNGDSDFQRQSALITAEKHYTKAVCQFVVPEGGHLQSLQLAFKAVPSDKPRNSVILYASGFQIENMNIPLNDRRLLKDSDAGMPLPPSAQPSPKPAAPQLTVPKAKEPNYSGMRF